MCGDYLTLAVAFLTASACCFLASSGEPCVVMAEGSPVPDAERKKEFFPFRCLAFGNKTGASGEVYVNWLHKSRRSGTRGTAPHLLEDADFFVRKSGEWSSECRESRFSPRVQRPLASKLQ